jgi:hypothetical protein
VLRYFSMTSRGTRVNNPFGQINCWVFWAFYLVFCFRLSRFLTNYLAAWKQNFGNLHEVVLFADSKHESILRVPCPSPDERFVDDKYLAKHLYHVYNICRIRQGLLAVLIPKIVVRVEVIEVCGGQAKFRLWCFILTQ